MRVARMDMPITQAGIAPPALKYLWVDFCLPPKDAPMIRKTTTEARRISRSRA
jgi:hypothetical protein